MYLNEIATKADLEEILIAIKQLHDTLGNNTNLERQFLRSADVRNMLNISDGTLQRLRISGVLKGKKINGTWFYKASDIDKLINS